MKRIGIFAGTFDPIHNGHIAFAESAIEKSKLDKLFFVPEPTPRNKQAVKSFQHRLAMVETAAQNTPKMGVIELKQPQFTVNSTLPALQARFSKESLIMLFGEDVISKMLSWANVETLLKNVELVVGVRSANQKNIEENIKNLQEAKSVSFAYQLITTEKSDASSSEIRKNLSKSKYDDLPAGVADYIKKHGLYRSAETGSGS